MDKKYFFPKDEIGNNQIGVRGDNIQVIQPYYRADEVDAALAAKDAEIERLRGVVHKVSETRDTLHAERDNLKRQLAEARRALELMAIDWLGDPDDLPDFDSGIYQPSVRELAERYIDKARQAGEGDNEI